MTRKNGAALDAETLAGELARDRAAADVRRTDELARDRAEARHGRDRADVAADERLADLDRAEREEQARADADLARMYREAQARGERTRIAAQMARSGEMRAVLLDRLRGLNVRVLVPVLLGFAAWSTAGVHHGAARLMDVDPGAAMWWALWLLEPVLIGAVTWVITARARLASAGGRLAADAERIAYGCLGTSIALNLVSSVPEAAPAGGWTAAAVLGVLGAMLAHAIGPVGAAATAHLIGVVDASASDADPWHDERGVPVPLLADMDLRPDRADTAPEGASERASDARPVVPVTVWPVPVGGRVLLPLTARPDTASETAGRSMPDQGEQPTPDAPADAPSIAAPDAPRTQARTRVRTRTGTRADKGTRVPAAARKHTSTRKRTDEELSARLAEAVAAGTVPADASNRAVQDVLGVGRDRAKRIQDMTPAPARLTAVDAQNDEGAAA